MDFDLAKLYRLYFGNGRSIPEKYYKFIFYQFATGLYYLKENKTLHSDIKPINVLLDVKGVVKIADFDLAKRLDKNNKVHNAHCTLCYQAPERLLGKIYTGVETDVWSFAVSMFELLIQEVPYSRKKGEKEDVIITKIFKVFGTEELRKLSDESIYTEYSEKTKDLKNYENQFNKIIHKYSQDEQLIDILTNMLQIDPNQRLTIEQVLNHPYFLNDPFYQSQEGIAKIKEEFSKELSDLLEHNQGEKKRKDFEKYLNEMDEKMEIEKEDSFYENNNRINSPPLNYPEPNRLRQNENLGHAVHQPINFRIIESQIRNAPTYIFTENHYFKADRNKLRKILRYFIEAKNNFFQAKKYLKRGTSHFKTTLFYYNAGIGYLNDGKWLFNKDLINRKYLFSSFGYISQYEYLSKNKLRSLYFRECLYMINRRISTSFRLIKDIIYYLSKCRYKNNP